MVERGACFQPSKHTSNPLSVRSVQTLLHRGNQPSSSSSDGSDKSEARTLRSESSSSIPVTHQHPTTLYASGDTHTGAVAPTLVDDIPLSFVSVSTFVVIVVGVRLLFRSFPFRRSSRSRSWSRSQSTSSSTSLFGHSCMFHPLAAPFLSIFLPSLFIHLLLLCLVIRRRDVVKYYYFA